MNSFEIMDMDHEYLANTYARFPLAIKSGKNATCKSFEGKEYIDFTSGIGVNALGFCDDRLINTLTEQAKKLWHISNLYYNENGPKLAKLLCEKSGCKKVFFANSGAEANEGAIKLARKYSELHYGNNRKEIITLTNSFHGRTITTLAATGQDVFHQHFSPFTEGFVYAQANNSEDLLAKVTEKTCAILIEPIQGEGGVLPLEQSFTDTISKICKEKDLLLIVDEVQTGIGRTGKLFAYEHFHLHPDIVTSAKGLGAGFPIGAILMYDRSADVFAYSDHGSTFGGNPLATAVAYEALRIITADGFYDKVKMKSDYLFQKLQAMPKVKALRGMGLMIGIDIEGATAKEIASACLQNGLLVLTAKNSVRLLPPLSISFEEIDQGLAILNQTINAL